MYCNAIECIPEPTEFTQKECFLASALGVTDAKDDCSSYQILGLKGEACLCFEDLCNSAAFLMPAFALTIISLFTSICAI
jgi:hypothetical protein